MYLLKIEKILWGEICVFKPRMSRKKFTGTICNVSYVLLRYISKGSYGSVWKGQIEQSKTIKLYAFKFFIDSASYREEYEAHLLLRNKYMGKNIVKMIDYNEDQRVIVMDYISGSILDNYEGYFGIEDIDSLKINQFLSIFTQTMDILHSLALSGLVHADIKPQNILITMDYQVYLVDIGLLRIQGDEDKRNYSRWWRSVGAMHGHAIHEDDVFAALVSFMGLLFPKFNYLIQCTNTRNQYKRWLQFLKEEEIIILTEHYHKRNIHDDVLDNIVETHEAMSITKSLISIEDQYDYFCERIVKNIPVEEQNRIELFWFIIRDFMKPMTAKEVLQRMKVMKVDDDKPKEIEMQSPVEQFKEKLTKDMSFGLREVLETNKNMS